MPLVLLCDWYNIDRINIYFLFTVKASPLSPIPLVDKYLHFHSTVYLLW